MKTTDKLLIAVFIACAILVIKLGIEMPDKSVINIILVGWLEMIMLLSAVMVYIFNKGCDGN